ncbi:hypothetical protein EXIGLDRAFT_781305 [Exidia glandulosa HHB12029]|uniref:Uncharacterized protein n=1 Tax=Exidia glandulosa HHB12029 TaxID=1314781 RepID=A0A165BAE0_EXIGL|nr:hypothetical protein EXIGLDRAFT_781305 [Exidia glandulosa HHB12029]
MLPAGFAPVCPLTSCTHHARGTHHRQPDADTRAPNDQDRRPPINKKASHRAHPTSFAPAARSTHTLPQNIVARTHGLDPPDVSPVSPSSLAPTSLAGAQSRFSVPPIFPHSQ